MYIGFDDGDATVHGKADHRLVINNELEVVLVHEVDKYRATRLFEIPTRDKWHRMFAGLVPGDHEFHFQFEPVGDTKLRLRAHPVHAEIGWGFGTDGMVPLDPGGIVFSHMHLPNDFFSDFGEELGELGMVTIQVYRREAPADLLVLAKQTELWARERLKKAAPEGVVKDAISISIDQDALIEQGGVDNHAYDLTFILGSGFFVRRLMDLVVRQR